MNISNILTSSFLSVEAFPGVTWLTIILIAAAVVAATLIIMTAVYYSRKSKGKVTNDLSTTSTQTDLSASELSDNAPAAPVVAPVVEKKAAPVVAPVVEKKAAPVVAPVVEKKAAPVVAPVVEKKAAPVVAPVVEKKAAPVVAPVVEKAAPVVAPVVEKKAAPVVAPKSDSVKPAEKVAAKTEVKAKTIKSLDGDNNTQSFGKYALVRNTFNAERPYMFQLLANNGQLLFESEQYKNKPSATIIKSFQKNAIKENFRIDADKTGKFRYKLFSGANKLIGVGESCPNKQSCESAIDSVIRFAASATVIEDQTEV